MTEPEPPEPTLDRATWLQTRTPLGEQARQLELRFGTPDSLVLTTPAECLDALRTAQEMLSWKAAPGRRSPGSRMAMPGHLAMLDTARWLSVRYDTGSLFADPIPENWDLEAVGRLLATPPRPIVEVARDVCRAAVQRCRDHTRAARSTPPESFADPGALADPAELRAAQEVAMFVAWDFEPTRTCLGAAWALAAVLLETLLTPIAVDERLDDLDRLLNLASERPLPPGTAASYRHSAQAWLAAGEEATAESTVPNLLNVLTRGTPAKAQAELAARTSGPVVRRPGHSPIPPARGTAQEAGRRTESPGRGGAR